MFVEPSQIVLTGTSIGRKRWKIELCNIQKRVDKKGRKPKETYEIGEVCLVQDMTTRQWSKKGTVISIRTAQDGTVVSYLLDINGFQTPRHRRFLRKLTLPDNENAEGASEQTSLESERDEEQVVEPVPRRSERLRAGSRYGF